MVIGVDASRAVSEQRTGTEAYAFFLIRALIPQAVEQGHQLRLYFNQAPPERLFPRGDHVEQVIIPFSRLWTHVRLARELARRPPDIFYTPAHVIPYSYRGASVATIHDLGFHYFPEAHTRQQVTYLRWSTRHNSQRSKRVIVDSGATKDDLIRIYAVDQSKIDIVYPGIDPGLLPVRDEEILTIAQKKYGLTPPFLLYIGTLQPRKNLSRLVEAYIASGVNNQLVLAGKIGWRAQPLLDQIDALQDGQDLSENGPRILLPGFIDDEDKAALISGASALLFPSLYEGFGFPVVEANACGTPVLCSNTSSLPEIASGAALEVDPLNTEKLATSIRQITGDEELRRKLISAGAANARRFSWEQSAQKVLSTLTQAGNRPS